MSIEQWMARYKAELGPSVPGDVSGHAVAGIPRAKRDSQLVQRAVALVKAGDLEALHFLYVRHAPAVLNWVAGFVNDRSEAEDITQGVFSRLVTTIDEYDAREGPFATWILRVARRAALDPGRVRSQVPGAAVGV